MIGKVVNCEGKHQDVIAIINSQTRAVEKTEIVPLPVGVSVTCAKYGPFDNGFIVLGLSNGEALGLNYTSLAIDFREKIFDGCPVNTIAFEPMHSILFTSHQSDKLVTY